MCLNNWHIHCYLALIYLSLSWAFNNQINITENSFIYFTYFFIYLGEVSELQGQIYFLGILKWPMALLKAKYIILGNNRR